MLDFIGHERAFLAKVTLDIFAEVYDVVDAGRDFWTCITHVHA